MSPEQKPTPPTNHSGATPATRNRIARYSRAGAALVAVGILTLAVYSVVHKEPDMSRDLTDPIMATRARQVISSFENSTTELQYGYAENLDDGRGITAGPPGFCTGTECGGDLLRVVEDYTETKPDNILAPYIPALQAARDTNTTSGLENLSQDWAKAAQDPAVREAQDEVFNDIYRDPALDYARRAGISSAAGQLVILDTMIQHGGGTDPDGLPTILNETVEEHGQATGDEEKWIKDYFLENRRKVLLDPNNEDTADAWRESVDRVNALQSIVNQDLTLANELTWSVYGDRFSLPKAPEA